MIRFFVPWAAAALVLLAGPVLIHMLLRRHARRVVFPAARFLIETRAAAVRLRHPSDVGLLLVRLAILTAAIAAAAQPLLMTPRRLSSWDARIVRAVVVDTSVSAAGSNDATRLAQQEVTSAFLGAQFAGADLRDALGRASEWLAGAPPGRREVVILSDFQRGALDREDLGVLPASVGLRTIRAANAVPSREARMTAVTGFRGVEWTPSIRLDANATAVTWSRTAAAARVPWLITSQPERDNDAAARAVHAAISAGVASGDDTRTVRIRFAGAAAESASQPVRTRWMVDATRALRQSGLLRQTTASVVTAERDGQLIADTTAAASSLDAAAVVRAIVLAVRPASIADRETEIVTTPDAELAAWRRDPAPLDRSSSTPRVGDRSESDAKWLWGIALVLLGLESWLRSRIRNAATAQVRNAA